MTILAALPVSLLLTASPPPAPSPAPTWTPTPIRCVDATGNPLPEAANPITSGPGGPAKPPKLVKRVNPIASRNTLCRLPTTVMVEALVTSKGDVCGVVVIGEVALNCEGFAEALRAAVKHWKFEPARDENDQPVAVYFVNSTRFR